MDLADIVDLFTAGLQLLSALVSSGIIHPGMLHSMTTIPAVSHPSVRQDLEQIFTSTPKISVMREESPCAGQGTLRIRYHVDSSTDCVDLNDAHVAQVGDAKLLIVMTVDQDRKPNNAVIYRFMSDSAKFLGTGTFNDHKDFAVSYEATSQTVIETYTDSNGDRKRCLTWWADGRLQGKCV